MATKKEDWDVQKALSAKFPTFYSQFATENPIIYALSIGLSKDPKNEKDLQYTYENHEDFSIWPTYGANIPAIGEITSVLLNLPGIPSFNPMMLLHGEQRNEMYQPIQPDTIYSTDIQIKDIQDKGKGMTLTFEISNHECDENKKKGVLAHKSIVTWFIRGMGGFGFAGTGFAKPYPKIPKREPCAIWEEKTEKNQAILYRLTGDKNPLHIDPKMAAMGGFDTPILHGMNFYGIASKAVVKKFCNEDEQLLKAFTARFIGSVYPGESLTYKMWKEPGNIVVFLGLVGDRKIIVGYAEIKDQPKL